MDLVLSCPLWSRAGDQMIEGSFPTRLLLRELSPGSRPAAAEWSRHCFSFCKYIRVSLSRIGILHYQLATYRWFFISWLKREAVKGGVFLAKWKRPALLPDTKSMLFCHFAKDSVSSTLKRPSSVRVSDIWRKMSHIKCPLNERTKGSSATRTYRLLS